MSIHGAGYNGAGVELPRREAGEYDRKRLIALDREGSCEDAPTDLPMALINEEPNLFQPRFESIGFAPGRSEAHVAGLAKTAKRGDPLDPVSVVSFGDKWYLVDGHHRLAAYRQVEWSGDVPVNTLETQLRGDSRITWAIEQSYADNKKNRLSLSSDDKSDGAWRAVARGDALSQAETASTYGVSPRTVGTMRETKKKLEGLNCRTVLMVRLGWRGAKRDLRDREENNDGLGTSWKEAQQRKLAKRLRGVMDMNPTAKQLAEALEAYSPNIVAEMAIARSKEEEDSEE